MTSYFDEMREDISWAAASADTDRQFLAAIETVEARAIADINLVTGDREFPDDLREKIQGLIATCQTKRIEGQPPTRHREMNAVMRHSQLLIELHRAFHEVGSRRIETRFGILSDHPRVNLNMRADHETQEDEDRDE